MNVTSRIHVEFGETAIPRQIPVRHATATASRLPNESWVKSPVQPGNLTNGASTNRRSVETDRLIARIRKVLQKQGTR